jgi:hypothetical protein
MKEASSAMTRPEETIARAVPIPAKRYFMRLMLLSVARTLTGAVHPRFAYILPLKTTRLSLSLLTIIKMRKKAEPLDA